MKEKNDPITSALSKSGEVFIDLADIGISELITLLGNGEIEGLKQIPFIKEVIAANQIRSLVQSAFFIKKFSAFIGIIRNEISSEKDKSKLKDLFNNDKKYRTLVEYSLIEIDRYQSEQKTKLLGVLFTKTFKDNVFTIEEYNYLLFSIENMHPFSGINRLKEYYEIELKMTDEPEEQNRRDIWRERAKLDYSPLGNTGFLNLPSGGAFAGDLGGAAINELGAKFYLNIVKNLQSKDFE